MTTRPDSTPRPARRPIPRLRRALPFWASLGMVPLAVIGTLHGGWTVALLPLYGWLLFDILDTIGGVNTLNEDPATPETELFWYRAITLIWLPVQAALVYWMIWHVTRHDILDLSEKVWLFFGAGVMSGMIGIVYAHELLHQKNRAERLLGDLLLAMVLYAHFRSEHLRIHHLYVGTPRDAVTARYNEGFHRFFFRVLRDCLPSAWAAEKALLARRGLSMWSRRNPFWLYGALQLGALALAFACGGWTGVALFAWQAFIAVWQLELVNYVEHYGLTRRHLGEGKYEHVLPRHSWNAAHRASNWLLINLQRHSDHHYKPDRRFPLLQTYDTAEAPQLPHGYPLLASAALIPPLWRRLMNPRVRAWRKQHYPDITDWKPYNRAENPLPKGAP